MWRTDLVNSTKQYLLVTLFYGVFLLAVEYFFNRTAFDCLIFISVILLVLEWWRACCYFKTIRGELALFHDVNELYWLRQRWYIIKKPIFLRYAVIIHLMSKRHGKKRVLFLMDDSLSRSDWRSLNYYLRQLMSV